MKSFKHEFQIRCSHYELEYTNSESYYVYNLWKKLALRVSSLLQNKPMEFWPLNYRSPIMRYDSIWNMKCYDAFGSHNPSLFFL
jgi:hypothetical protein